MKRIETVEELMDECSKEDLEDFIYSYQNTWGMLIHPNDRFRCKNAIEALRLKNESEKNGKN